MQPVHLVLPSSGEEEAGGGENWDKSLHFVIDLKMKKVKNICSCSQGSGYRAEHKGNDHVWLLCWELC